MVSTDARNNGLGDAKFQKNLLAKNAQMLNGQIIHKLVQKPWLLNIIHIVLGDGVCALVSVQHLGPATNLLLHYHSIITNIADT